MTLRDNAGTTYVMEPFEDIDGSGTFAFSPGVPAAATSLDFGEPGRSLIAFAIDSSQGHVTPT